MNAARRWRPSERVAAKLAPIYRRPMMTPAECHAARSLLKWSQLELAEASGSDVSAIRDFESGKHVPVERNVEALRRAFEAAGVRFVSEIGGGAGVRLNSASQGI